MKPESDKMERVYEFDFALIYAPEEFTLIRTTIFLISVVMIQRGWTHVFTDGAVWLFLYYLLCFVPFQLISVVSSFTLCMLWIFFALNVFFLFIVLSLIVKGFCISLPAFLCSLCCNLHIPSACLLGHMLFISSFGSASSGSSVTSTPLLVFRLFSLLHSSLAFSVMSAVFLLISLCWLFFSIYLASPFFVPPSITFVKVLLFLH